MHSKTSKKAHTDPEAVRRNRVDTLSQREACRGVGLSGAIRTMIGAIPGNGIRSAKIMALPS